MSAVDDKKSRWISSISDLPGWFNLDNYSDLILKDTRWWFEQLAARCCIFGEIERLVDCPRDEFDRESLDWYRQILEQTFVDNFFSGDQPLPSYLVKPVTVAQAGVLGGIGECCDKADESLPIDYAFEMGEPVTFLELNLDASDEAILRDVKKTIQKIRVDRDIPEPATPVSERKFLKLTEYRVLPLLDLLIWEQKEGKRVKKSVLSAAIFPGGEKGERELTETVIPFALQAVSVPFLDELFSYQY